LKDFPKEDRPPVLLPFISFRIMVGLGFLFLAVTIYGWFKRKDLDGNPRFLKLMLFMIPLPYIANEAGWMLAEVGRQPWVVYGVMRTSTAVSPINAPQVMTSLVAFVLVYSLLGAAAFYLMASHAKKGPEPVQAATETGGVENA
jgi:cytochrome d ubiquinol oxidase subunit I